ncbi:SAM-dependent methyltransferase (plasmid) [Cereibacter sphaeroides]|nr:SAM-dependent methyltransferase [Cereibacter sphaeroides]
MARALAESTTAPERLALARAFGVALMSAWWSALTAAESTSVRLRPPLQDFDTAELPDSAAALAASLGKAAAQLDPESAAYQIGLTYTCTLPRTHRAELGIYYTPPCLTARLIAQATASGVNWATCRVLDPACGGGAFLAPVARQIVEELQDCSPRILVENIANRLRGYEIDPFGAWLSQVTLDAVLLPITQASGRQLPVIVTVCDSLQKNPPRDRFDLVIGNPPYGRVRLDPVTRERFKRSLFGHANLYGLFTDLALRHVRPGGVVAYVTPTSFLAGEYFKNLRTLLGRAAPPATFDFVSVRKGVFDDVLQETLLATYRHGSDPAAATVHEITPVDGSGLSIEDAGSFTLPDDPASPWILPRCAQQGPLVATLSRMTHRLADWGYTVSTGPLVWNRYKDQLVTRSGRKCYPLIWAEAITSDGCFIWRAEKKNHAPWFQTRPGDDWLVTSSLCVLLQRTTAKEQSRRLIAAALPAEFMETHGAVVIENHLNMLRPLPDRPAVPAATLAAFLNSAAADRAFRCVSGSVAVSAYELKALPLPAPEDLRDLTQLIAQKAGRAKIEAACAQLYEDGAA